MIFASLCCYSFLLPFQSTQLNLVAVVAACLCITYADRSPEAFNVLSTANSNVKANGFCTELFCLLSLQIHTFWMNWPLNIWKPTTIRAWAYPKTPNSKICHIQRLIIDRKQSPIWGTDWCQITAMQKLNTIRTEKGSNEGIARLSTACN